MVEFFSKAGVIRINHSTLKPIVKIYRGEDGTYDLQFRIGVREMDLFLTKWLKALR